MSRPAGAFLSFASIHDGFHQKYNAWHQLDHRPENLALDGVLAGERWVRTPACAAAYPVADLTLARTHYVNSYWFRAPVAESMREWQELAELSFQQGRRPDVRIASRPMMGMFNPVTGLASGVSPLALLHRPNRGVVLSVLKLTRPRAPETEAWLADREDEMRDRLRVDGVAGVWSLSSVSTSVDPSFRPRSGSMTFDPTPTDAGYLRAELTFLDGDPLAVAGGIPALAPDRVAPDPAYAEDLFTSLLLPIVPWQWDWF
jgi:hypothetical protein